MGRSVGGRVILGRILEKKDGVVWIGLICLRIGTSRGFYIMLENSREFLSSCATGDFTRRTRPSVCCAVWKP
jgi:hypothetical protein